MITGANAGGGSDAMGGAGSGSTAGATGSPADAPGGSDASGLVGSSTGGASAGGSGLPGGTLGGGTCAQASEQTPDASRNDLKSAPQFIAAGTIALSRDTRNAARAAGEG